MRVTYSLPCSHFPHFLSSLHPSFLLLQLSITHRAVLVLHGQVTNSHAFNCLKWCRVWSWGSYGCPSTLEHTRSWVTGSCARALIYSSGLFPRRSRMVRILGRVPLLAVVLGPRVHFLATWRPHSEATCNPYHIGAIVRQTSLLPDQQSLSLCTQPPLNGSPYYVRFTRLSSLSLIWNQCFSVIWLWEWHPFLPILKGKGFYGNVLVGSLSPGYQFGMLPVIAAPPPLHSGLRMAGIPGANPAMPYATNSQTR